MAWSQTDIDALKAAMAQGATRVRYADREVQYRTLADMVKVLSMMQSEVDAANSVKKSRLRIIRMDSVKGL